MMNRLSQLLPVLLALTASLILLMSCGTQEKLEGKWKLVLFESKALPEGDSDLNNTTWTFEKDGSFEWKTPRSVYPGSYELADSKNGHNTVWLTIEGHRVESIYRFESDTLHIKLSDSDAKRPTNWEVESGFDVYSFVREID